MQMQSEHYLRLERKCGQDPKFVRMLNEGYSYHSNELLTREVRFVLEKCLSVAVLECIAELDFSDSLQAALLFPVDSKIANFISQFRQEMKAHFTKESQFLCSINQAGPESEIRLYEIEDRYNRLMDKFETNYSEASDCGFKFLGMIKSVLDFESRFLLTDIEDVENRKRRYSSVFPTTSSKGLVAKKFIQSFPLSVTDNAANPLLSKTLASLKAISITVDRVQEQIDALENLSKDFLGLNHRVSAINDPIASLNLLALEKETQKDKGEGTLHLVYDTCKQFEQEHGMLRRLANPMLQLLKNSFIITKQSDQVIRIGSRKGSVGTYFKLNVRFLFAKFFEERCKVTRNGDLHVAVLSPDSTQKYDSMSATDLCQIEQASSSLIKLTPIVWNDESEADVSLLVKDRPPSTAGPKPTQAFAICLFFLTKSGAGSILPDNVAVSTLSKPISFITNDNQRSEATAAIYWYSLNEPLYPLCCGSPRPVSIKDSVRLIKNYILEKTKHELNAESVEYFLSKCRTLSPLDHPISFHDFCKKPIMGKQYSGQSVRSLWDFVFSCVRFIQDSKSGCRLLFMENLVYGFVTQARAAEILCSAQAKGLCSSQLALIRFSETMATVTVALRFSQTDTQTNVKHEVPRKKEHFESISVAEFVYSPLPFGSKILKNDGTVTSAQSLQKCMPSGSDSIIPGYVALCREIDLMSICSAESFDFNLEDFDADAERVEEN